MLKSEILNRIMSHYGLRNKTELASFLGVSPQTVSNWYSRNFIDYDLVFEKCAGLDFNWLVTGNASVYGHRIGNVSVASDVEGAYDVPVASMLPVGMTGGSCPVGDGAVLRSGGMPAVLSSDGECIACVADGAMPDEFRSGDVLVGKRIVDFGAVDTDGLTPYVFALRSGGLMVRRVIADKNFPEKLLLVAGSPDRRQFPDIVVKRADLCGVWDVKFTLVSYGSGGGNIGERLSELERRMDELTKRIDDAASAGGAGR